jgi:arylsulfatase A-like enzyme
MRFTQFYAGANVCAPSRSVLMTGLHTGHTAVRNNGLKRFLYDEDVTVAEVLKKAGYATGGFGKWGLGLPDTPGVAVKQGFDTWFGQYSQTHAHFYYPYFVMRDLKRVPLDANEGKRRGIYVQDAIHEQALAFIEANRERPFFADLPYILPHVELVVPRESRRPYEGQFPRISRADPRPGYLGSDDAYAEFAGMVSHLDQQVGQVMAKLKELGIDDNTIVFFTSDNGPQPGAWTDIFVEFFDGNGPHRGAKGDFYEGGIGVPLIVRWPGKIEGGSMSDFVGYFPDMMPTLAKLAGVNEGDLPANDGISLAPTLLGQEANQKQHDYLYWEAAGSQQNTVQQAVRFENWKGVRPGPKAAWQIYDLAADPAEERNLATQRPEKLARIESICREAHTPERKYEPAPRESAADYVR